MPQQDTHTLVLNCLDSALGRLTRAHTALLCESSPDSALLQSALAALGNIRAFWCGEGGANIDVAHSLRTLARQLEGQNHHVVRAAYQDIRDAEGIVDDNTTRGTPVSR
jgi:hypothetical protein